MMAVVEMTRAKNESVLTVGRSWLQMGSLGAALCLLGCAGGSTTSASPKAGGEDSSQETSQPAAGDGKSEAPLNHNLPDFELETLDGDTVRLSELVGEKVILIDFWATFCDPCLVAMPHLNDLYKKYESDGFVVLGISIDGPESLSRVRSEVRKLAVDFPILLDPETEALALYNPKTSAPFSILIDKKGNIIKKKEGFTPTDVPELEKAIVSAL